MKVQEQQEQQAKKKEKEKQIKNSSVKLKKDQQKTIDEYDDATAQFSALSLIRKLIHLKLKSPLSSKAFQLKRSMSVR